MSGGLLLLAPAGGGLGGCSISQGDPTPPCPRMRLCTSATESEVVRGKNLLSKRSGVSSGW